MRVPAAQEASLESPAPPATGRHLSGGPPHVGRRHMGDVSDGQHASETPEPSTGCSTSLGDGSEFETASSPRTDEEIGAPLRQSGSSHPPTWS